MKVLTFIFLVGLMNGLITQKLIIEATYIGYEEGTYTFIDEDEEEYEFSDMDAKVAKKYDLDTDEFVGKKFKVTYESDTEVDENEHSRHQRILQCAPYNNVNVEQPVAQNG